jgi:outer membrane protein OmpA-like peptidoglycan-associated protein
MEDEMKHYYPLLGCVLLIILMVLPAYSEEPLFETTTKGIIEALTDPEAKYPQLESGLLNAKKEVFQKALGVRAVNLKIEFDINSYTVRKESFQLLNNLGRALTSKKLWAKKIMVKGHTDSDGHQDHNERLSMARAQAVTNYLMVNFPIPPHRMKAKGYGETEPLVPNSGNYNKQINRRVEIQIDE